MWAHVNQIRTNNLDNLLQQGTKSLDRIPKYGAPTAHNLLK